MLKKLLLIPALVLLIPMKPVKAEIEGYTVTYEYETRLTSYYPTRANSETGCGLTFNNFDVNENGWFTYNGRLVVATATDYLLNYGWKLGEGVRTYEYYQELILEIDKVDYLAVVLDSCGLCMTTGRIDLFVVDKNSIKDTTIIVKEITNDEMI